MALRLETGRFESLPYLFDYKTSVQFGGSEMNDSIFLTFEYKVGCDFETADFGEKHRLVFEEIWYLFVVVIRRLGSRNSLAHIAVARRHRWEYC